MMSDEATLRITEWIGSGHSGDAPNGLSTEPAAAQWASKALLFALWINLKSQHILLNCSSNKDRVRRSSDHLV
jgi:hypothetical protein